MLLDKLLRQNNRVGIFFIADICNGHNRKEGENVGFSIADVYFLAVLLKWFVVFFSNSTTIPQYLEATLVYINQVRFQLQKLFDTIQDSTPLSHNLLFISINESTQDIFPPFLRWSSSPPIVDRNITYVDPITTKSSGDSFMDSSELSLTNTTSEYSSSKLLDEVIPSLVQSFDWSNNCFSVDSNKITLNESFWTSLDLPAGRESRKRQQIESLLPLVLAHLPENESSVCVEFCAGGGYLGLAVAALRPAVSVLLLDRNAISLKHAEARADRLGLHNVSILRAELVETVNVNGPGMPLLTGFAVGMALHACGPATDQVLALCETYKAAFIVSPCCYGFIQQHTQAAVSSSSIIHYPRSFAFRQQGCTALSMSQLCSRADRTFWSHDPRASLHNLAGMMAMTAMDSDRLLRAKEIGYVVSPYKMYPLEASPKNHILVGYYPAVS
eukprot:CAMPEP_0170086070 /NCGR_PEP_ID=MMETSP0019_2-20121128/20827_1 /TAXON_ID=98059 /ORGANISM="Dinobryon sp., Strain UTEXLB2267" /LENGTH=442 /DNA_ID=CAMNT_0010302911 /DNA_START=1067 /DNA_END=2395 /DNA_ORIENTATION=-